MDREWDFFTSGQAHVFYALAIVIALALLGVNRAPLALAVIAALAVGVFVDLWIHGYKH